MEHLAGDCRLWSLSLVCLFGGRPLGTRPHECLDWYHSRSSCWFFEIYWADQTFKNKLSLALFTKLLLVFLATGLFFGGCHEFEDVWGETREVWSIKNDIWSHKELPMATFKPFGSSASRTVLQIACLWCWLALSAAISTSTNCTKLLRSIVTLPKASSKLMTTASSTRALMKIVLKRQVSMKKLPLNPSRHLLVKMKLKRSSCNVAL